MSSTIFNGVIANSVIQNMQARQTPQNSRVGGLQRASQDSTKGGGGGLQYFFYFLRDKNITF